MKLNSKQWCKIQQILANLKCSNCFSVKVNLAEEGKENAVCKDCGCKFEFNPEVEPRLGSWE